MIANVPKKHEVLRRNYNAYIPLNDYIYMRRQA
jgi:hypothetical protein